MELAELVSNVKLKAIDITAAHSNDNNRVTWARLVALREFLNEQPELEAGGSCESAESSNGS